MKTKQATHTPTPWKLTDGTMTSFPDSVYVSGLGRDGFQSVIAIMNDDSGKDHDKRANAAYIVRCVNSHEELLDAVKSFDLYIRNNESGDHGDCKLCKLIAKAEGQNA